MTKPYKVVRFSRGVFGADVACLGMQVSWILERAFQTAELRWSYFDVESNDDTWEARLGKSGELPSTAELIRACAATGQFLSGVFLGYPRELTGARGRACPHTEDDPMSDLGDAVVEIRCFDTSYIDVAVSDSRKADELVRLGGAVPDLLA